MEAVKSNVCTTYKDVANIVSKLNENNPNLYDEEYDEPISESVQTTLKGNEEHLSSASKRHKQEKNLRRRVYDSLNVLYAVGVLNKDANKKVTCNYEQLGEIPSQLSKSAVNEKPSIVQEITLSLGGPTTLKIEDQRQVLNQRILDKIE